MYLFEKSRPKKRTFFNFLRSSFLDFNFNLPNETPFCFQNLNFVFFICIHALFFKSTAVIDHIHYIKIFTLRAWYFP